MRDKIQEILTNDVKASLSKVAKELEMPLIEVLRQAPTVKKYDVAKIDDLFAVLRSWEKVFLIVITPAFVIEIQDKFAEGFYGHGYFNFHDKNSSIGGHLSVDKIKEIFLVKDVMFGRESYSIRFYGEDEKEIFAIYVPRDEKKELIQECVDSFKSL
ncbi:MAG: heme utilization cystosolic carrier protein HutX [Cetobacterium sp.]|uniref:heme utilization cystosolic carrier protein HutX n=1 Tax=unclassified Cetobacterium TaxID=2630983 RepID=UPI0006475658|nr:MULTISPECIES: heme utilization cystosolic carrier protein HutX [unclassified Cetobacterium]